MDVFQSTNLQKSNPDSTASSTSGGRYGIEACNWGTGTYTLVCNEQHRFEGEAVSTKFEDVFQRRSKQLHRHHAVFARFTEPQQMWYALCGGREHDGRPVVSRWPRISTTQQRTHTHHLLSKPCRFLTHYEALTAWNMQGANIVYVNGWVTAGFRPWNLVNAGVLIGVTTHDNEFWVLVLAPLYVCAVSAHVTRRDRELSSHQTRFPTHTHNEDRHHQPSARRHQDATPIAYAHVL